MRKKTLRKLLLKSNNNTPSENTPLKAYLLKGFSSQEQAEQRLIQLQKEYKSPVYGVKVHISQTIQGFEIVIPGEAICHLTEEERKHVEEYTYEPDFFEYNPIVFRFIREKYVDQFFETGALRLSTFRKCAMLEDANRNDAAEGRAKLIGHEKELCIKMEIGIGNNAILLCSSLSINNVKANGEIDNCCIEVRDVNNFVIAVTKALVKDGHHVRTVLKGPCVYSDRIIETSLNGERVKSILQEMESSQKFDFGKLIGLGADIAGNSIFFCKPLDNRFENEYRMIWLLEEDTTQDTYDVLVPEARQFCRKIIFDSNNQQMR